MTVELESHLVRENCIRSDVVSYVGNQLIRQRKANEAIVGFAQDLIPPKALVIDACAGPEGSYLACARRGYRWIGNEISASFAQVLGQTGAQTVLSDFSKSPFRYGSSDATFIILALNNIYDLKGTLSEAKRATKVGGIIVEAEPGLSSWTGRVILHSLLSDNLRLQSSDYYGRRGSGKVIEQQFQDKPYSEHEYVDHLLENTMGQTRETMADELKTLITSLPRRKVFFNFQQAVVRRYFEYIDSIGKFLDLRIIKAGVMAMGQTHRGDWIVTMPIQIPPEKWIQAVLEARKWQMRKSELVQQLPRSLDAASKRIILPVLCLNRD